MQKRSYFITKCNNIPSLKRCVESGIWACRDRSLPPQPREFLTTALENGEVILIFSVNNCHGYHGYCTMTDKPGSIMSTVEDVSLAPEQTQQPDDLSGNDVNSVWFHFPVRWETCFLREFGEQCLHFCATDHLVLPDQKSLNKCRNWQEIDSELGDCLCQLINKYYQELCNKKEANQMKQLQRQPAPFLQLPASTEQSGNVNWQKTVQKVESELGKVLIACPFGSQRYNLHNEYSDTDMFLVYAANTTQLLGFYPPKQTIKSHATEECDYTIHELYRFCELLIGGDPRCVECLFLHESCIICSSDCWKDLRDMRKMFLTRECLDKYMRDALGSNGVKQLKKWTQDHGHEADVPNKIYKLVYIIVRLLQNALDIIKGDELKVFRENGSTEKELLMKIRNKQMTLEDMWSVIERLEAQIDLGRNTIDSCSKEAITTIETWLLKQRYENFIQDPP